MRTRACEPEEKNDPNMVHFFSLSLSLLSLSLSQCGRGKNCVICSERESKTMRWEMEQELHIYFLQKRNIFLFPALENISIPCTVAFVFTISIVLCGTTPGTFPFVSCPRLFVYEVVYAWDDALLFLFPPHNDLQTWFPCQDPPTLTPLLCCSVAMESARSLFITRRIQGRAVVWGCVA